MIRLWIILLIVAACIVGGAINYAPPVEERWASDAPQDYSTWSDWERDFSISLGVTLLIVFLLFAHAVFREYWPDHKVRRAYERGRRENEFIADGVTRPVRGLRVHDRDTLRCGVITRLANDFLPMVVWEGGSVQLPCHASRLLPGHPKKISPRDYPLMWWEALPAFEGSQP